MLNEPGSFFFRLSPVFLNPYLFVTDPFPFWPVYTASILVQHIEATCRLRVP